MLLTGAAVTASLTGCTGAEDDEDEADLDEAEAEADEEEESEYIDEADDQIELAYGEEARHSDGIVMIAHGLEFESDFGDFQEPDDGNQYAMLHLEVRNESDEAERFPLSNDIVLLQNDNQYDSQIVSQDEYEDYDGGEVQPDVTREGYIAYEVPDELDESDLDTVWYDDFLGANIDVRWTG